VQAAGQFSRARNISLETYRKSGDPVRTTVFVVEENGVCYVRTDPRSGKAKRIRRNPLVRLVPSDMRGNVKGVWVDGEARFVEGDETRRILGLFRKKYGAQLSLLQVWHKIRKMPPYAVISIRLISGGANPSMPSG